MERNLYFRGGRVLDADFTFRERDLAVQNGKLLPAGSPCPEGAEVLDARGKYVLPGLLDTHFHGGNGVDFQAADADGITRVAAWEAAHGVTTMLPTIGASADELLFDNLAFLRTFVGAELPGARVAGVHMEGPFLAPACRGAMLEELLQPPSVEKLERYIRASGDTIRSLTLAPELPGAEEVIRFARERGVTVQLGHSAAGYACAVRAADLGATVVTHTCNAMKQLHHREPGLLGAALDDERLTCELIADLFHVQAPVVRLICRAKGGERVNLVSDSMYAAGLPDGDYTMLGRTRIVRNGEARLPNGTISGSSKTVYHGVKNLVGLGFPLESAVRMASANPARTTGLSSRFGSIEAGKEADLTVWNPSLEVAATFVGGRCVYRGAGL